MTATPGQTRGPQEGFKVGKIVYLMFSKTTIPQFVK